MLALFLNLDLFAKFETLNYNVQCMELGFVNENQSVLRNLDYKAKLLLLSVFQQPFISSVIT